MSGFFLQMEETRWCETRGNVDAHAVAHCT